MYELPTISVKTLNSYSAGPVLGLARVLDAEKLRPLHKLCTDDGSALFEPRCNAKLAVPRGTARLLPAKNQEVSFDR
jgi:hypothetical protein